MYNENNIQVSMLNIVIYERRILFVRSPGGSAQYLEHKYWKQELLSILYFKLLLIASFFYPKVCQVHEQKSSITSA